MNSSETKYHPFPMRSSHEGVWHTGPPFIPTVEAPTPTVLYMRSVYRNYPSSIVEDAFFANNKDLDRNHIRGGKGEQGGVRVVNPSIRIMSGSLLYSPPDPSLLHLGLRPADEEHGALYIVHPRKERHPHVLTPAKAIKLIPHPGLEGEDRHIKNFIAEGLKSSQEMAEHILRHSYRGLAVQAAVRLHSRRLQYHFGVQRVRRRWCLNSERDPWTVAQAVIGNQVEQKFQQTLAGSLLHPQTGSKLKVLSPDHPGWTEWERARAETTAAAKDLGRQITKSMVETLIEQDRTKRASTPGRRITGTQLHSQTRNIHLVPSRGGRER